MKHLRNVLFGAALLLVSLAARTGAADGDKTELEGVWIQVAVEMNGEKKEPAKDTKLTVTGNKYVLKAGDKVFAEATFKLDPSKKPKAVDATYLSGPRKGKTFKGIYERDGDTARFCGAGSEDDERPTEFKTTAGKGGFSSVYKREKP